MSLKIEELGTGKDDGEYRFFIGTRRTGLKFYIVYPKIDAIAVPNHHSDNSLIEKLQLVRTFSSEIFHVFGYHKDLAPYIGAICMGASISSALREYFNNNKRYEI